MKLKSWLLVVLVIVSGCRGLPSLRATPTPPPGWRLPVAALLLSEDALPRGWAWERDAPDNLMTDPTINHVYRSWWWAAEGQGGVEQAIWRSYTTENAEKHYADLRQRQFAPQHTLPPYVTYLEFVPPPEIVFQSTTADEFYVACGFLREAHCIAIGRYRNYVTQLNFSLENEYKGLTTRGLTYRQIEALLEKMDARFSIAMLEFYGAVP